MADFHTRITGRFCPRTDILEYQQEQPVDLFCLDGRPHLKLVRVARTDVTSYQSLMGG